MRATFKLTFKSYTYLHKPSADYKLFVNKLAYITNKTNLSAPLQSLYFLHFMLLFTKSRHILYSNY